MNNPHLDPSIPQPQAGGQGMSPTVQARLLDLNRLFYATVGGEFDRTRQGLPLGMVELAQRLAERMAARPAGGAPLHVLDVGCGNGRLARALAGAGLACAYTGIDADVQLLKFAAQQTADLPQVTAQFVQLDIAVEGWTEQIASFGTPTQTSTLQFDVVACLAVLHHFPGLALRSRLVRELTSLLAPGGVLALSTWQFLSSERLAQKQADWAEVGVNAAEVEEGDALLPWNQGAHALRYVHQLELPELQTLAAAAGLHLAASFRADGKEGNLNLYTLWER